MEGIFHNFNYLFIPCVYHEYVSAQNFIFKEFSICIYLFLVHESRKFCPNAFISYHSPRSRMQIDICVVSTIFPVPQISVSLASCVTCIQQIYNLILRNLDIRSLGINISHVGFISMMYDLKDQPKLIINTPRNATMCVGACASFAQNYC